jgi:Flp pilus assembly protein TadG
MRSPLTRSVKRPARGQSLVEFALVIPIFLLILFALIDMGRLVYINNAIAEGAREGARWGSVYNRASNATSVQSHAAGSLAAVPDPAVSATCVEANNPGTTCGSGDILVVRIATPVTMLTPIVAQIVGPQTYTAVSKTTIN